MGIIIGSARHDENGKYISGKKGDQLQKSVMGNVPRNANAVKQSVVQDMQGECSMQNFYIHSKGWFVLRPISKKFADMLAYSMETACNNKNIGYSQGCQRKTIDDVNTLIPINVDCSKLVRDCIYNASHVDVGNFTTSNEVGVLEKCGMFDKHFTFKSLAQTPLYDGDVLVTKTKGHTVIVVKGASRPSDKVYYPKYIGSTTSLVTALKAVGEQDATYEHRKEIAKVNGVSNYSGTATQNTQLLKLLKNGTLIKV